MNRRLLTALGAGALIVATVMPAGVTAARPHLEGQAKRFERVDTSKIDKSLIKAILSDHDVNVIVEMTGPSATARGGSKVQQVAVAGRLKAHQDALARSVRTMGGTVEAKYQYAYNGIKVRVAEPQGRGPREAARRQGDPPGPDVHRRQPPQRAVHRRPGGVAGLRRHRERPDDRRHRHRHRLHPRQLRRGGHRGRVRRQRLDGHRARVLPDREGHRRLGLRRRRLQPGQRRTGPRSPAPTPTRSTATATARTSPARPPGSASSPITRPTPAPTTRRPTRRRSASARAWRPRPSSSSLKVFGCDGGTSVADRRTRMGRRRTTRPMPTRSTWSTCRSAASAATRIRTPRPATRWRHRASWSSPRPATKATTRS